LPQILPPIVLLGHPITKPHHRCSSTEIRIDVAE
jgi:hypothetical protein